MRTVQLLLVAACLAIAAVTQAQEPDKRHVTPVQPPTNVTLPPERGTSEEVIKRYLSGDTAKAGEEARRDSLRRAYKRYPRLTDLTVGVNFIDPLLMAFGQDYASVDVHATLNMWNRLQPVVEAGLGWGRSDPDDMNFTYRAKPSPYFKLGANYNFTYKSEPRYQAVVGLRLAYSPFRYEVTDVNYDNTYWNEHLTFDIPPQSSHALWGEIVAGLRVGLWKQWSLGWMVRYHALINYGSTENARPWFIPGYGPRRQRIAFTVSAAYTLPLPAATRHGSDTSHDRQ